MKILLFVGALQEKLSANSNIVFQLALAFSQMGHTVWLVGKNNTAERVKKINDRLTYDSFYHENIADKALDHLQQSILSAHLPREQAIRRFAVRYPLSALRIKLFYWFGDDINRLFCKKKVAALCRRENFDAVLAVQIPFWGVRLLSELSCPQKNKFVYQLDPYGLHEFVEGESRQKRIALEVKALQRVNKIFTTPVLAAQYRATEAYRSVAKKTVPVEFPNVVQRQSTAQNPLDFDADFINICYCGLVQERYRSPEVFLKAIGTLLARQEKIRLYFVGDIQSESIARCQKQFPDAVFLHEKVDIDTAFSIMGAADCLLNFSNNVTNQVPSKIFDYFSTGKPILNVQLIENCPALAYLQRYPLCYTLKAGTENSSDALLAFLKETRGKSVPFERVAQLFEQSTLDFVARKMLSAMEADASVAP